MFVCLVFQGSKYFKNEKGEELPTKFKCEGLPSSTLANNHSLTSEINPFQNI